MGNPGINNIPPTTGRILDEYGSIFNLANFFESLCSGGYETGASGCSTDIHALTGIVNFNISADADAVNGVTHNVVVNVLGLTTGSLIATAVQSAIWAVGGTIYANTMFTYANGVYNTLSGSLGPGSKIRITAGTSTSGYTDLAAALKIGAANGAVDTDGVITGLPVLLKATPTIDIGEVQIGDPNTPSQKLTINAAGAASVAEATGVLPTGVSQATGGVGLTGLLGAIKGWLDGTLSTYSPKVLVNKLLGSIAAILNSGVAGTLTGGASPITDIHSLTTPQLQIACDADVDNPSGIVYHNVTLATSGNTTGALTAAAAQAAINTLGVINGVNYSAVTVTYTNSVYVIISPNTGTGSKVRIAAGTANDVTGASPTGMVILTSLATVADGYATPVSNTNPLPIQVSGSIATVATQPDSGSGSGTVTFSPGVSGVFVANNGGTNLTIQPTYSDSSTGGIFAVYAGGTFSEVLAPNPLSAPGKLVTSLAVVAAAGVAWYAYGRV